MKGLPVVLGMMLAVSLLFNVVAFVRLAEEPAVPGASPRGQIRPEPRAERSADAPAPAGAGSLEEAAPAAAGLAPTPAVPATPTAASPAPTITTSSLRNDPEVRDVLQANEAFSAFWKDLDRVFKLRSKFDERKYSQTVLTASSDFLGLEDPRRAQFEEASKSAAMSIAAARKEQDAAKKALPPKDKTNPAALAAYEQQKDLIGARYDTQVKAAVDTLKPYLNAGDARHQEFLQSAERWLRNLAPRASQP